VEDTVQVEAELRNARGYSFPKARQIQPSGGNDKLGTPAIYDGSNEAQCLNKRRLPRIVLANHHNARLEQDSVIVKASEILHPELAEHTWAFYLKGLKAL
jgi:hypothetical protein